MNDQWYAGNPKNVSPAFNVKPRDRKLSDSLDLALRDFEREFQALPGLSAPGAREALLSQLVDSVHRVTYPKVISQRPISAAAADPQSEIFDPIKAAVFRARENDFDEACWLVFLFVHFGKSRRGGWRYLREVYGRLGQGEPWSWQAVIQDTAGFRTWILAEAAYIQRKDPPGGFGNHRKYESLAATTNAGTAAAVESYVAWIAPPRTHREFFDSLLEAEGGDPRSAFNALYRSMSVVQRFGRTARFDYLAMLGKLGLVQIVPDQAYLRDATGPLKGARLLFGGSSSSSLKSEALEARLQELDGRLGVGMQVFEDALCNWQKSPTSYVRFLG